MRTVIQNFTKACALIVKTGGGSDGIEPLVMLSQRDGAMEFLFSMTPSQASDMAAALIAAADDLEMPAAIIVAADRAKDTHEAPMRGGSQTGMLAGSDRGAASVPAVDDAITFSMVERTMMCAFLNKQLQEALYDRNLLEPLTGDRKTFAEAMYKVQQLVMLQVGAA